MARNHVPTRHAFGPQARAYCGARPAGDMLVTGWRRVTCVRCCEAAMHLGGDLTQLGNSAAVRYAELTLPGRTDPAKIDAWLEA